jgi:hypothetical protein
VFITLEAVAVAAVYRGRLLVLVALVGGLLVEAEMLAQQTLEAAVVAKLLATLLVVAQAVLVW